MGGIDAGTGLSNGFFVSAIQTCVPIPATPPRRVRALPLPPSPLAFRQLDDGPLESHVSPLASPVLPLTEGRLGRVDLTTDSRPECPTDGQGHNPIAEVVNARIVGEHHGLRDGFVQNRIEIA